MYRLPLAMLVCAGERPGRLSERKGCAMILAQMPGRREALLALLSSFALVALAREARGAAMPGESRARLWIDAQQDIAEGLAQGRIGGVQWALEVERLAAEIDVGELMAVVDRSRIRPAGASSHNDPRKRFVRFLDEEGRPRRLAYGAALFDFAPHNVVTPHGHRNMVSAHLVVAGRLRVRNFDRLGDEPGAIRIRPTRDYVARPGQVSTMCAERDNIHWFVPQGGAARTFDVLVSGLDAGQPDHLVEAVDPVRARRAGDGSLTAPIIGFESASRLYTSAI